MKQALILIDEINRKKAAVKITDSEYLKRDYLKSISSDIEELKTYCEYRGYDFSELEKRLMS